MKYAERIERLYELRSRKNQLYKEIKTIDHDIQGLKESCDHIGINLGYKDWTSNDGKMNICLICAKLGRYTDPKFLVHAEEYMEQFDPMIVEEYQEKFDVIQIMALGMMKHYPEMEREELVELLNDFIQDNIQKRKENQGPQFTKKSTN